MIDYAAIRNEVRRRMIFASGIDAAECMQFENHSFDPKGKSFWIAEYVVGGNEQRLSSRRSRINPFLIQYNLNVQPGSGMDLAESKARLILMEFDINDADKSTVTIPGYDISVLRCSRSIDPGRDWHVVQLLLYLDVNRI